MRPLWVDLLGLAISQVPMQTAAVFDSGVQDLAGDLPNRRDDQRLPVNVSGGPTLYWQWKRVNTNRGAEEQKASPAYIGIAPGVAKMTIPSSTEPGRFDAISRDAISRSWSSDSARVTRDTPKSFAAGSDDHKGETGLRETCGSFR